MCILSFRALAPQTGIRCERIPKTAKGSNVQYCMKGYKRPECLTSTACIAGKLGSWFSKCLKSIFCLPHPEWGFGARVMMWPLSPSSPWSRMRDRWVNRRLEHSMVSGRLEGVTCSLNQVRWGCERRPPHSAVPPNNSPYRHWESVFLWLALALIFFRAHRPLQETFCIWLEHAVPQWVDFLLNPIFWDKFEN